MHTKIEKRKADLIITEVSLMTKIEIFLESCGNIFIYLKI
jgi:hypothetical protein